MPKLDRRVSDEDLRQMTGINADEEKRIEASAARGRLQDMEKDQTEKAGSSQDTGAVSPEGLAGAEKQSAEETEPGGESTGGDTVGRGYQPEGQAQGGGGGRFKKVIRGATSKKGLVLGGSLLGFLIIIFIMWTGFSAFELINLRENLLGQKNRFTNAALQRRRAASFGQMLRKLNNGTFETNINKESFKKAFEKNGFKVLFSSEGRLLEFGFTDSGGKYIKYDLNATDPVQATNDFFGSSEFGQEASIAYDRTLNAKGALWRGPFARAMYRVYGFIFYDWPDRKASENAKTPKEQFNDKLRHANDIDAVSAKGLIAPEKLAQDNATVIDGDRVAANVFSPDLDMENGINNNGVGAKQYGDMLKNNPGMGEEILGQASDEVVTEYGTAVSDLTKTTPTEFSVKAVARSFVGRLPGRILDSVVKGLNIVGAAQTACAVKGTLNFVSNVRNILVTIELARFAVLWLSAADNQKAGILTSSGLNLLMIYLHTPLPHGTYWGALNGNVTQADRSRMGVGRNNDGVLGSVSNFINNIPGARHCNVVNNGFVVAGGFAVGIVAAILTGGTELGANIATALTIGLIQELIFQIATPLLIKAGAHMMFNGFENSTTIGAGISSGFGALAAMDAGANGMRPTKKSQLQLVAQEADQMERLAMSQQSVFDRYFNPENGTSLLSRVGMAMPKDIWSFGYTVKTTSTGILSGFGNFGLASFFMPGSAKAAAAETYDQCTDPQIVKNDIAADMFCNPVMAETPRLPLQETEAILKHFGLIDDSGTPTTQNQGGGLNFHDYVENCFRGRPGILYTANPDTSGNASPEDDTCAVSGDKLPGDSVGKYDRYASWWGYIVDRDSMVDQQGGGR